MPTKRMRVLLFLSSYSPLFVIIGILMWAKNLWVSVGVFAGVVICLLVLWIYLWWCRRNLQHSFARVRDYRRRDSDVMTYVASYVVPFATFPLEFVPQILALLVFLGTILILYVHSNLVYVNPILSLRGYHLYDIDIEHGDHSAYYIARKPLKRGDVIHYVSISDEVLLEDNTGSKKKP